MAQRINLAVKSTLHLTKWCGKKFVKLHLPLNRDGPTLDDSHINGAKGKNSTCIISSASVLPFSVPPHSS